MDSSAPRPRWRFGPYAFHIISSLALTSMAFHVLNQRRAIEAERFHIAAKTTILEDLAARIRGGNPPGSQETERLLKLAETHSSYDGPVGEGGVALPAAPSWREVIFGRKQGRRSEERELENVRRMWEEAISATDTSLASTPLPPQPLPVQDAVISQAPAPTPVAKPPPQKPGKMVFY